LLIKTLHFTKENGEKGEEEPVKKKRGEKPREKRRKKKEREEKRGNREKEGEKRERKGKKEKRKEAIFNPCKIVFGGIFSYFLEF
jgi:hypothetical protein